MRIEETKENEILVTVDVRDQERFGIRYESICFSDPKTRRLCESLAILLSCTDDREDENLTVRAFPGENGELLLYFSFSPDGTVETRSAVAEFDSCDAMLSCGGILRGRNVCAEMYRVRNRYCLWFESDGSEASFEALCRKFSEFATVSPLSREFLCEHGDALPAAVPFFF